jgi:hypothetical protein
MALVFIGITASDFPWFEPLPDVIEFRHGLRRAILAGRDYRRSVSLLHDAVPRSRYMPLRVCITAIASPLRFEVRAMDGYRVALVRVERIDQRPSDSAINDHRAEDE